MLRVLVVDDDETLRMTIRACLLTRGYEVSEAADGVEALEVIEKQRAQGNPFEVVILDVNMPRMSGIEALSKIKQQNPATLCLVLTAYSNVKCAVNAIKYGAYDYLEKPVDGERILQLIDSARQANSLIETAAFSAPMLVQKPEGSEVQGLDEAQEGGLKVADDRAMIGESSSLKKVFNVIFKLSKVDTSVLIRGESGTGKELVARAIHYNSHRKKGPFVAVNCAAIPENLIESELFGHEKGAFTGADRRKIGKFQYAEGGTLFLDEIGDISPQMQVKLLRVLQERRFTPVGSNMEIPADLRVIAATNRPLEQMITTSTFRADLFYRLNVLPIMLPPLRERREDLPSLINFMIKKFNKLHNRSVRGIEIQALNAMRVYNWPGNIRELENVIEHAFILESEDVLSLESLPAQVTGLVDFSSNDTGVMTIEGGVTANGDATTDGPGDARQGAVSDLNYPALKEKFEKEFIIRALKTFDGRVNQTAEHTQMTKVTLLRKLEKYGIDPKQFHRHN
jgi:DNA-binding NtrC family response regulator